MIGPIATVYNLLSRAARIAGTYKGGACYVRFGPWVKAGWRVFGADFAYRCATRSYYAFHWERQPRRTARFTEAAPALTVVRSAARVSDGNQAQFGVYFEYRVVILQSS
jgi:hypothetical protein